MAQSKYEKLPPLDKLEAIAMALEDLADHGDDMSWVQKDFRNAAARLREVIEELRSRS
jgi:hypothetical protein